jgi:hypothetical protein
VAALFVATGTAAAGPAAGRNVPASVAAAPAVLTGHLRSGALALRGVPVDLYRTAGVGAPVQLGHSVSAADGSFRIAYQPPGQPGAVLYVTAGGGSTVRLAAALGTVPAPKQVVVTERTTVAAGFALAEFISDAGAVAGRSPGVQNAAAMAGDLADLSTGGLSRVLSSPPNGAQSSTLREFNTLANMISGCARAAGRCGRLFQLATPPGGHRPSGVLAAVADITRNPAHNAAGLFKLAHSGLRPYQPTLTRPPGAWTLVLRFDGNGHELDGPAGIAVDAHGNIWIGDNLTFSRNPTANVCGGDHVSEFTPTGQDAPGAPFYGGGLFGNGIGVAFDPHGHLWLDNFGFTSTRCKTQPPHNSVSEFTSTGRALSPPSTSPRSGGGWTEGNMSWPQATTPDRRGNIWIASCGNNTVTRFAGGNPHAATNFGDLGITKPFSIALNRRGQVFVDGNENYKVAMLNPDGSPARPPISGHGLYKPMTMASDIQGNIWVENSGFVGVPCPNTGPVTPPANESLTLISSNGKVVRGPFKGGGLDVPWGIAVDGNDNVWVTNFAGHRLSEFCGTEPRNCPPGTRTGQPITPASGYRFDASNRAVTEAIDQSGNVWVSNNWLNIPLPKRNPGGHQMLVYIGVAGPVHSPLIGTPQPLDPFPGRR